MAGATIQFDQGQVDAVHALLDEITNGAVSAMTTALNRTLDGAKSLAAQEMGAKCTLKSGFMKDQMITTKANYDSLSARLRIPGTSIPLAAYQTTPTAKTFQSDTGGNGVSIKVWKDQSSVRFRHAFFAVMPNGYIGLFERRKYADGRIAGRLPIDELQGPPLTSIYENTPGLSQKVESESADRLLRELESNVNYILSKHA